MTEGRGQRSEKSVFCPLFSVLCFLSSVFCPLSSVFAEESSFSRAMAAYNERDRDRAFQFAQQAVRESPQHVDALALLGELYYLRQDLKKARECWENVLRLAPDRQDVQQRLDKLKKEQVVEQGLARSDTHPFVVRFADGQAPVDVGELRLMLRDAYRQVGQSFNTFPDHSITVLLYPEADFDKVKGSSHQVAGLYDGKIRLPLSPGRQTSGYLQRVLWHEYTHALVHDLAKGNCPLWLNEGIAQLQEARVQPINLTLFRAALEKETVPPWHFLWDQTEYDPASMQLNYQTAYVIANYLVKRGSWNGLAGLLRRLGQGYPIRDALRAQYGSDSAALERDWLLWLRRNL